MKPSTSDHDPRVTETLDEATRLERDRRAKEIAGLLRASRARKRTMDAADCLLIWEVERDRLFEAEGLTRTAQFAEAVLDWSSSKTSRMIRIGRELSTRPELAPLREAFEKGEVGWANVYESLEGVTEDNVLDRVDDAKSMSAIALRKKIAREQGRSAKEDFIIKDMEPTDIALLKKLFVAAMEKQPGLTMAQFVGQLAQDLATGRIGKERGAGRSRLLLVHCVDCKKTSLATGQGLLELNEESAHRLGENPKVVDTTSGESKDVARAVPQGVADTVYDRDQGKCQIPRCPNEGFLHYHHEGGVKNVGHDPEAMYLICAQHHRMRHAGWLLATRVRRGVFDVTLVDGTKLGTIDIRRKKRADVSVPNSADPNAPALAS